MTESEITGFDFRGSYLRALSDADGIIEFIAADVAVILGHRDATNMTRTLDPDERGGRLVPTPSGDQVMTVITEAGLYQAILQRQTGRMADDANRIAVKEFQRW